LEFSLHAFCAIKESVVAIYAFAGQNEIAECGSCSSVGLLIGIDCVRECMSLSLFLGSFLAAAVCVPCLDHVTCHLTSFLANLYLF
jgi:hypothetical protein